MDFNIIKKMFLFGMLVPCTAKPMLKQFFFEKRLRSEYDFVDYLFFSGKKPDSYQPLQIQKKMMPRLRVQNKQHKFLCDRYEQKALERFQTFQDEPSKKGLNSVIKREFNNAVIQDIEQQYTSLEKATPGHIQKLLQNFEKDKEISKYIKQISKKIKDKDAQAYEKLKRCLEKNDCEDYDSLLKETSKNAYIRFYKKNKMKYLLGQAPPTQIGKGIFYAFHPENLLKSEEQEL